MPSKKRNMGLLLEIPFDLGYLLFGGWAGMRFLSQGSGNPAATLYGILTLLLCFGDAFHLLPRVYALWSDTMAAHTRLLGFGKAVTSVTMTLFYLLLYRLWELIYGLSIPGVGWLVLGLTVLRILLCLLPQNRWLEKNPPLSFAILRNIPFAILGGLVAWLYLLMGTAGPFGGMPLAILLSFLFYFGVVLFAGKYPAVGALMLPKTCMYIWIITMGFSLL